MSEQSWRTTTVTANEWGRVEPALVELLTTLQRTAQAVERLGREQRALQEQLDELVRHDSADRQAARSVTAAASVGADEFRRHARLALASLGAGASVVLAAGGERGLPPALLLCREGRDHRAILLGPLEESLLMCLHRQRECARDSGRRPEPIPAKVLAARVLEGTPWAESWRTRPAPGTVRSAFTRLRKKLASFGAPAVQLLQGGREGYRLAGPTLG